ncbi:hypothetical protein R1flu_027858 [Riccia fluitans]|uniref:BSD domain-containing protein n=1 Tax=Riccia fluitans TaxID=41844 RepID=A0ABD1XK51_9MARC
MSWFTRSFSLDETKKEERAADVDDNNDDEGDEEEEGLNLAAIASATGKGVKEDLTQLTKSFTRQLWGVASFLAPPPPQRSPSSVSAEDSQEDFLRSSSKDETIISGGIRDVEEAEGVTRSVADRTRSWERTSGEALALNESDSRVRSSPRTPLDEGSAPTTPRGGPRLTGLRSDFAELRGSVATGLSRISNSVIRAVAGDGSGDENEDGPAIHSAAEKVQTPRSSEGVDQSTKSSGRGFDSFLKPLLGNMLKGDGSEADVSSEEDDDGANTKERQEQTNSSPRTNDSLPSAFASGIDGISKFLLQIVQDEEYDEKEEESDERLDAVGLNEAVVTFAKNIAMHPETWLDFPLPEDENEDDFVMNDVQKEHAHALEIAAPGLKALRIELCPNYMSEGLFWLNYFVLLHSRLSPEEAQLLSTSQVLNARASLVRELEKGDGHSGDLAESKDLDPTEQLLHGEIQLTREVQPLDAKKEEAGSVVTQPKEVLTTGNIPVDAPLPMPSHLQKWGSLNHILSEPNVARKVSQEAEVTSGAGESSQADSGVKRFPMLNLEDDEAEVDEWLDDEPSIRQDAAVDGKKQADLGNMDEDVSFSDFEDDDTSQKVSGVKEPSMSFNSKAVDGSTVPEAKRISVSPGREEKGDGSQTRNSDKGDSDDWLTVDQDDVVSTSSSP